jgi:hypothetical protein
MVLHALCSVPRLHREITPIIGAALAG